MTATRRSALRALHISEVGLRGSFWNRRKECSLEAKKSFRLGVESLEDRSLMAALAGGLDSDKLLLATNTAAGS